MTRDLSYNKGLSGGLHALIGRLSKLENLLLTGCSFSGEIPPEIGLLSRLVYLSLDYNSFTGSIPPTIGNLSKLYVLDLTNNKLTGTIPISNGLTPGLDMLLHAKHLLLDSNNLSGSIPSTLGLVTNLTVVRLDKNSLTGPVPSNLNNLMNIGELNLANNNLSGPLPNLTGMNALSFVDMSNNSFDPSDIPSWFSTLPVLTSLYLEHLNIGGLLPQSLFSFSLIETLLIGNPVCNQGGDNLSYCKIVQSTSSYSTPQNCETVPPTCSSDQTLSPNSRCYSFTVSWDPSKSTNSIPQLKGARLFSFEEVKKCTNNFSEANEIGHGGYGKVYRGILSNGRMVAIKRAQQCSLQGGLEFKTEIELLSRVHHKNLVSLVGFCFDQDEQMLIYEYVPNGTLKESLSGTYLLLLK
ncbi:putative leucine-rich repeat receptor-like protein kinase, partial [Ananas comosus]